MGRKATGPTGMVGLPKSGRRDYGGVMSECIRSITEHARNYVGRDYLPALLVNPFPQPARPRSDQAIPSVAALVETQTCLSSQHSEEIEDIFDAEVIELQYARPKFPSIAVYLKRIQISAYKEAESLRRKEEGRTSYLNVHV